ncbi:MAG: SGNH/GDSL hydrolase family protein [Planctomycetes bacterium]|nr:SGNH/GDSL hydrolase family protein [Planctomycetota bacterium]
MTSTEVPRHRRSRLRSCATLVPVLLLALLGGAEVVVRALDLVHVTAGVATPEQAVFYASHMFEESDVPGLGYRNRPLAAVTAGAHEYRNDAAGRRVIPQPATAEGAPGVAFLGDSTTYGWGVSAADCLPAVVAARADGALRALNLGVIGYGTEQEAALYDDERDRLGDDVRVVVLVFYPNDTVRHSFRWDDAHGALYVDALPVPEALKATLWHSALYRGLASWHGERLRAAGELDAGTMLGVSTSLENIARLARDVSADGRTLVVAHLPGMVALDPYPFDAALALVEAQCERLDLPFVDLLPAFLARRESEIAEYEARTGEVVDAEARHHYLSRFWVDPAGRDQHLNAAGNAVAGEALAAALEPILASLGDR